MFPSGVTQIIAEYASKHVLLDWANQDKIYWCYISFNINISNISTIHDHLDDINWAQMSSNPSIFRIDMHDILHQLDTC
jgi:hypothetical protein